MVASHLPGRTPTGARNHFKRLRERDAKLAAQTALVVHSPVALECHERLDAASALRVEVEGDADGDVAPWSAEELASADWEAQDAVGYDGRSPEEAAALALLSPTAGSAAAGPSPPTSARRPGPAPQRFYPGPPGSAAPTPPAEAFYPPARASARAPKPTEAARQSKDTGATSHLVGDGPTYMCLFDGCGKMYSSTDSARKHCRQRHTGGSARATSASARARTACRSASTRGRTASATCEGGERRVRRRRVLGGGCSGGYVRSAA